MRSAARKAARPVILSVVSVGALAACGEPVDEPQTGPYRAALKLPGGETPFGLEVAKAKDGFVLYLANASERTRVDNVTVADGELKAVFAGGENTLRARMYRDRMEGSVTLIAADSTEQEIPFSARHGQTHRFYKEPLTDNADLAGRWEMTLTGTGGNIAAVATFEQQHDRVTGTVMTPTGNQRLLEGQVHGDEAQLSTFAGGLAYLYKLEVNHQGELEGDLWQGLALHFTVRARRMRDHADEARYGAGTDRPH